MKNIFIPVLLLAAVLLPGQTDFSGTAEISINAALSDSGDYSTLLNPDNLFGVTDISTASLFTVKLDSGDDTTTFTAWFSMKENTFDLMRLSANVYLSDDLSLEAGRQNMLTGYGYGWNPLDFANSLKDPSDPSAELKGVNALTLSSYFGSMMAVKLYALFPDSILSQGIDYEEVKPGGEITFSFPGIEIKLTGMWDYDKNEGSDAYTPAVGGGINVDFFGAGIYAEGAYRKGSRNYFPEITSGGLPALYRKTGWLFSGLIGCEYTFPFELNGVVEYFYNGEGLNSTERGELLPVLAAYGGIPSADLLSIYRQGYFSRQYLLVNLVQPLYTLSMNVTVSSLYSIDSGALILMPRLEYDFSGSFAVTAGYTGMFDLDKGALTEVSELPFHHQIQTVFTYSF